MVTPSGSVFGFDVQSPYPLRFLRRGGGGGEHLTVVPCRPVTPPPDDPPFVQWTAGNDGYGVRAQLYCRDDSYRLETTGGFSCLIDPRRRTIRVMSDGAEMLWEPGVWGLPALLCFQERGDLSLHAAAVEVNGGAILFAAGGRSGKTTLALAFHNRGYRVLSEDLACCRLAKQPTILPGPALLRLRPDMYDGRPPQGTRVVAMRPDRVTLEVDEGRRGCGSPVPIRAIVLLQDVSDGIRLEPIAGVRALPYLWPLTFALPNESVLPRRFGQLSRLVSATPVWRLFRPLSRTDLPRTVDRLIDAFGS